MDYPHPLEVLKEDGTIDLSKAYEQKIGDWDKVAINFGYREFPKGTNEKRGADEDHRRRVGPRTCATTPTRTSTFIRRSSSGPTAPTRATS